MRCQDDRGAHTSFTKAQSQLAAVLHAIPRKTEFDLWPMEFGITPTLSTVIDNISDIHIKALLFELNLIRVDAKSHTLVITTRDTFMNIASYLANHDVDFEVNVNPIRQHHNTKRFGVNTFIIHTKDIQKETGNSRKRRRRNASIPLGKIDIQYLDSLVEKLKRALDPPSQGLIPSVQIQNDVIPKRRGKNKIVIKKAGSVAIRVPSNIEIKTTNFMNKQKKSIEKYWQLTKDYEELQKYAQFYEQEIERLIAQLDQREKENLDLRDKVKKLLAEKEANKLDRKIAQCVY
jgi:hypothetical protein